MKTDWSWSRTLGFAALLALTAIAVALSRVPAASVPLGWDAGPEGVLDISDQASRMAFLDYAQSGASFWPRSLIRQCGTGANETYRLVELGSVEPTRLVELRVAGVTAQLLVRVADFRDEKALSRSPRVIDIPQAGLAEVRRAFVALVRSGIPAATGQVGSDGVLLYVEACHGGRYSFYFRWTPDPDEPANQRLVHFVNMLLTLARQEPYGVIVLSPSENAAPD